METKFTGVMKEKKLGNRKPMFFRGGRKMEARKNTSKKDPGNPKQHAQAGLSLGVQLGLTQPGHTKMSQRGGSTGTTGEKRGKNPWRGGWGDNKGSGTSEIHFKAKKNRV